MLWWDFLIGFLFSKRSGSVIRLISWITFLSLTLSITVLIVVLGVMKALNFRIQDRMLAAEPHLWIEIEGAPSFSELEVHPVALKLQQKEGWSFHAQEVQDVILRTVDGRFQGAEGRGLTEAGLKDLFEKIRAVNEKQGHSSFGDLSGALDVGEVMMGVDLAASLGVFEGELLTLIPPEALLLPLGESPRFETVRIRQILTTNLADIDSKTLFYRAGQGLMGSNQAASSRKRGYEVWLPQASDSFRAKDELLQMQGVRVQTWQERHSALFMALRLERMMMGTFLSLAATVAGLSLVGVLGLLISQKRKEFGLLKAMGLGPRGTLRLLQGLGMGLAGGGIGVGALLGGGMTLYLQFFPLKVLPDIYYDSEIPARFDFSLVCLVLLIGLLLVYGGCRIVAKQLVQASPSELLRHQGRV